MATEKNGFGARETFVDRVIGWASPESGMKRLHARATLAAMREQAETARAYDGAGRNVRGTNWKATGTSGTAELTTSLAVLRNRSRDLIRNNPYMKHALRVWAANMVGIGIKPTWENASIQKLWNDWVRVSDASGMLNFYAQQLQVARAMRESGECLIRFRMRRTGDGMDVPLQLQVLEADYLDTSRTGLYESGVNIAGIGFDALGRRTGYWLFDQHPGDFIRINANIQSRFVPASEVLHIYDATTRPNTIRGLPEFAVSIWAARDTEEYRDAQRVAKKIQAMWVAFATTADENFSAGRKVGRDDAGPLPQVEEVTPGTLTRLRVGEDVKFSAPAQILDYEPYMRTEHRGIAAGSDVTYEQMTGDFSQVNFTSGRMGKIEFRRVLEQQQELIFIPMLCEAVAERWCQVGYLSNAKFRKTTYTRDWTAPRIEMTDPLRETSALAMMVEENLISRQEAQRQIGQTPEIMDREIENDPLRNLAPETPDKPSGNNETPPDDSKPGNQDNAPAAAGSETRAARKNRSPLLRAFLFED